MSTPETFTDAELRAAYSLADLEPVGISYEQALRNDAVLTCLHNIARAVRLRADRDTTRRLATKSRAAAVPHQLTLEDA